ncbi:MAG: hypothetical protein ABSE54_08615 [Smithella sp.]|jgi:hypothetical protein
MKKINIITSLVLSFVLAGNLYTFASSEEGGQYYYQTVSLPKIILKTDSDERITSIKVVMHCGRFAAINLIPEDWSAKVVSPVSEETTLSMAAGHGTSYLWHSEDLNRFITVLVVEPSCFDITASITAYCYDGGNEHERTILFKQKELIMKKVPKKSEQRKVKKSSSR